MEGVLHGVTDPQVVPARISSISIEPVPEVSVPACLKKIEEKLVNVAVPEELEIVDAGSNCPGVGLTKSDACIGEVVVTNLITTRTVVPQG